MPERTVIQWDKECLEELGLFKVDLLGLGALHQLHLGFDLLQEHYDESFTRWRRSPRTDRETFDMICRADTVGVFQIESRAQMAMLPRLKPRTYYDLVIEVSIVRPGPITGGMVHPYLRRRSGDRACRLSARLSRAGRLKKTLGCAALSGAGHPAGHGRGRLHAGRGRSATARHGGLAPQRVGSNGTAHVLVRRMCAKGIEPEFAERVFEQIRGFGEYGFPESHAASFALIAYATAWMKCHYPDVFTCLAAQRAAHGLLFVFDHRGGRPSGMASRCEPSMWNTAGGTAHWRPLFLPRQDPPSPRLRRAIRMGLRYVKGRGAEAMEKGCANARSERDVRRSVEELR